MKPTVLLITLMVLLPACGDDTASTNEAPTWYQDVLPVAQASCVGCHNDDAPTFSMERYSPELAARAPMMARMTEAGLMPPWKPSSECNRYQNERTIGAEEIALFRAWADGGALEGDAATAPAAPERQLGLARVDRTLVMAEPYLPKPAESEADDLHCFVLDPELSQPMQMTGFDVHPGDRRVVHHALLYLADAEEAEALDAADPEQGYSCFGGPLATSAMVIAGWVPGMPANTYPDRTAIPLAAGSRLILQIHYNTLSAGPHPDQTSIDLQLSDVVPERPAQIMSLADFDFSIPPQTAGFTTTVEVDVPADATIWAVAPHMHLLGQRANVQVAHADGSDTCLIDIPEWDFDWQQFYFLSDPRGVPVNKGDKVRFSCTFDNTTSQPVGWGDGTTDEMCISYFYVTPGHVP